MEQNKDRVFPMTFSTEFTIKSNPVLAGVVGKGPEVFRQQLSFFKDLAYYIVYDL